MIVPLLGAKERHEKNERHTVPFFTPTGSHDAIYFSFIVFSFPEIQLLLLKMTKEEGAFG